jgi:hypothetical protein
MSAWGYTDNAAITGTVTGYTQNVNIVGSSTLFLSNVNGGDYITIAGQKYQVNNVTTNTALTLTSPLSAGATGETAYVQQGPKFVGNVNVDVAGRQTDLVTIQNVFGVTFEEMNTAVLQSIGIAVAGNYPAAARSNSTVVIATTGATQPTVNATATVAFTGANVTSFVVTQQGAGYTAAAQANTTAVISVSGATQATVNASIVPAFTSGTAIANASHQGWVTYRTYVDANGSVREKSEVLAAMSKNFNDAAAGDDEDTKFPD